MWIAPQMRLTPAAIKSMTQKVSGFPISMPSPEPVQRALRVHSVAVTLAGMPRRDPTVTLREIGTLRFQLLEALGLADTERLASRIEHLTAQDLDDLAYGVLDLAKASVDRLLEQATASAPPVVLCSEKDDPTELIGRTLFWADHYLVPDELADALLQSEIRLDAIEDCLQRLLALRPLIELGVVAPVPEDLATVLSARATYEATETDLQSEDLVRWIDDQLLVEGPTAREALIIGARDDLSLGCDIIYFHAHVDPDSVDDATRTFQTRLLTPYQPDFDYGPWIAQSRRQAVAQLLQDANRSVSVAEAFGGHAVTRSPFRARLLRHKETQQHATSSLVWADVPWLPGASATSCDVNRELERYQLRGAERDRDGATTSPLTAAYASNQQPTPTFAREPGHHPASPMSCLPSLIRSSEAVVRSSRV